MAAAKKTTAKAEHHTIMFICKELHDVKAGIAISKDLADFTMQMRLYRNFQLLKPNYEAIDNLKTDVTEKLKKREEERVEISKKFADVDENNNPITETVHRKFNGEVMEVSVYVMTDEVNKALHRNEIAVLDKKYKKWLDANNLKDEAFNAELNKEFEVKVETLTEKEVMKLKSKHITALHWFLPRKLKTSNLHKSVSADDLFFLADKGIEIVE